LSLIKKIFEEVLKMNSGDTAWVLMSTALVLLMTMPGLAFFYGGLVRRKNVLSILMQCFIILCVISLQWVLFGYSLAFGPDFHGLIGNLSWAGLNGVGSLPNKDYAATIPHSVFMAFQMMFAVITPALIIGAYAERVKFPAFLLFTILWATFVYDPLAHWVWGTGGWLKNLGALDFAGGMVVHISSGVSALVLALLLGKRVGLNYGPIRPHNLPFAVLGGALLWFGWFGFNAGSALAADGLAANAFVTTNTATAAAGLTWALIEWWHNGTPTILGTVTGAVAGLVAITPACGFVNPMNALFIGMIVAFGCYIAGLRRLSGRVRRAWCWWNCRNDSHRTICGKSRQCGRRERSSFRQCASACGSIFIAFSHSRLCCNHDLHNLQDCRCSYRHEG
jgi:Amt family ammonium transporter